MANEETTTMKLHSPITVNGVKYPRGMAVKVPKSQAEDLERMDYEATAAQMNLVRQAKQYIAPMGTDPV